MNSRSQQRQAVNDATIRQLRMPQSAVTRTRVVRSRRVKIPPTIVDSRVAGFTRLRGAAPVK